MEYFAERLICWKNTMNIIPSFLTTSPDVIATRSKSVAKHRPEIESSYLDLTCDLCANQDPGNGIDFWGLFSFLLYNTIYKLKWQNAPSKPSELWSLANLFFMCWMEYCSLYFIMLYLWIYYYMLVISLTLCWYFFLWNKIFFCKSIIENGLNLFYDYNILASVLQYLNAVLRRWRWHRLNAFVFTGIMLHG